MVCRVGQGAGDCASAARFHGRVAWRGVRSSRGRSGRIQSSYGMNRATALLPCLSCDGSPPLECSFVQLILCIVRPARSAQGRVCPGTTHKMLFILGNGSLLFPAALPCSLPRLYTGSVAPSASTMRHLRPTEKACRACAAADCSPQTIALTGAGSAGCHCTPRPGTDRAVHRVRAGIYCCPALHAPQAGDFFCAAVPYPCLP